MGSLLESMSSVISQTWDTIPHPTTLTGNASGNAASVGSSHPAVPLASGWMAIIACPIIMLGLTGPVVADIEITEVQIGLADHYRMGHWTPVWISLQSDRAVTCRVELEGPDGKGVPVTTVTDQVELAAGAQRIATYAKFGRVNSELLVRLIAPTSGEVMASRVFDRNDLPDAMLGSQNWVLSIGPTMGLDKILAARNESPNLETRHAAISNPRDLPDRWIGYSGCSLIVMPASKEALASQLSEAQLTALERWILLGGRFVFCAGGSGESALVEGGSMQRFLPGRFARVSMQRQAGGLENFAGTTQSLSQFVAKGELSFRLPVAKIVDVRGITEAVEGIGEERTPTVVRAMHGLGQVVFIAVDLDLPPLNQWTEGRRLLLTRVIDGLLPPGVRDDVGGQFSDFSQIGFEDLVGQLRGALDQFPGVTLVPFSWIVTLIGIYVLLIGPLDYFLLRKMRKRFSLTWFTFPVYVVASSSLALYLTGFWKGDLPRMNQVDLVDIDVATGLTRGNSWSHLYSPNNSRFNLSLQPTDRLGAIVGPRGQLLSWQGLPGSSVGGMNRSGTDAIALGYGLSCNLHDADHQQCRVVGLPIAIHSSRSLYGQFWGKIDIPHEVSLQADLERQLRGTVTNPLPIELRDCLLCFGRWAYPLPSLGPGQSASVGRNSKVRNIDVLLTRSEVDQDFKDRSQPWDRLSGDINRIMEIMMFHKASGGTNYTSLEHRYHGEIDLSDHLRFGNAILVGRSSDPVCKFVTAYSSTTNEASMATSGVAVVESGKEVELVREQHTFYRLVIPVRPADL